MDQALKERLVGATVLVVLVVIFLPMLLPESVKKPDSSEVFPTIELPIQNEASSKESPMPPNVEVDIEQTDSDPQSLSVDNQTSGEFKASEDEDTGITLDISEITEQSSEDNNLGKQELKTEEKKPNEQSQEKQSEIVRKPPTSDINRLKEMGLTSYVVQLGTFSNKTNADGLVEKLRKNNFPAFIEPIRSSEKMFYRVRVGPEVDREDALLLLDKLRQQMKIDGTVLEYP